MDSSPGHILGGVAEALSLPRGTESRSATPERLVRHANSNMGEVPPSAVENPSLDRPASSVTNFRMRNTISDPVTRFSVSLPSSLVRELGRMTKEKGYDNRSLAIADMIRAHLVEHRQQKSDAVIAGSITLVYDHHRHHLQELLTDLQHEHRDAIISSARCLISRASPFTARISRQLSWSRCTCIVAMMIF